MRRVPAQQWRNLGTVTPTTLGGRHRKGAANRPKMWDNFATLTAQLAKLRVLLSS